jgi:hypothetical protein
MIRNLKVLMVGAMALVALGAPGSRGEIEPIGQLDHEKGASVGGEPLASA